MNARMYSRAGVTGRSFLNILTQLPKDMMLKDIGIHFGIGESGASGASRASRRIQGKIKKDKRIKAKIDKMIRKLNLSRMKT